MSNDRFKFRWWNKRENLMEYDIGQEKIAWLLAECDTMTQCAGLKDKKGALIYEGDVVFNEEIRAPVKFSDSSACFYVATEEVYTGHLWEYWEVIGNIYENPELLEVK